MASIRERRAGVESGLATTELAGQELATLEAIQRRVLWLATNIIDYANHVRPNPDKTKVGGTKLPQLRSSRF